MIDLLTHSFSKLEKKYKQGNINYFDLYFSSFETLKGGIHGVTILGVVTSIREFGSAENPNVFLIQ